MDDIESFRMRIHLAHRQAARISNRQDRLRARLKAYEMSAALWRLQSDEAAAAFYDENVLVQRDIGWASFHEGEINGSQS